MSWVLVLVTTVSIFSNVVEQTEDVFRFIPFPTQAICEAAAVSGFMGIMERQHFECIQIKE